VTTDIEAEIRARAPALASQIREAAASSPNEAEFRTKITRFIDEIAAKLKLNLYLRV